MTLWKYSETVMETLTVLFIQLGFGHVLFLLAHPALPDCTCPNRASF